MFKFLSNHHQDAELSSISHYMRANPLNPRSTTSACFYLHQFEAEFRISAPNDPVFDFTLQHLRCKTLNLYQTVLPERSSVHSLHQSRLKGCFWLRCGGFCQLEVEAVGLNG